MQTFEAWQGDVLREVQHQVGRIGFGQVNPEFLRARFEQGDSPAAAIGLIMEEIRGPVCPQCLTRDRVMSLPKVVSSEAVVFRSPLGQQLAAPCLGPENLLPLVIAGVAGMVGYVLLGTIGSWDQQASVTTQWPLLLGFGVAALVVVAGVAYQSQISARRFQYKKTVIAARLETWKQFFLCEDCLLVFHPETGESCHVAEAREVFPGLFGPQEYQR
jgi:hypothetical protein